MGTTIKPEAPHDHEWRFLETGGKINNKHEIKQTYKFYCKICLKIEERPNA